MKTRKPITKQRAQHITMFFTFGTLGLALVLLTINWQISVAMVFGFLAGWIAMYNVAQAEKPTLLYERKEAPEKPRPTRDSIREWQSKN